MHLDILRKIKLLVTDVDGVQTDGGMYYFEDGNEAKKFNTKDGMAIQLLKEKGITVIFMTKEHNKIAENRAKKLNVEIYKAVIDKGSVLAHLMKVHKLQRHQVAYIGDDVNDISALQISGIAICPADAVAEVKKICNVVTKAKGGEGVLREIFERINGTHSL